MALLALRRLSLAGLRDNSDDMMVDACIGIEALLSEDSTDLTYKIASTGRGCHRGPAGEGFQSAGSLHHTQVRVRAPVRACARHRKG